MVSQSDPDTHKEHDHNGDLPSGMSDAFLYAVYVQPKQFRELNLDEQELLDKWISGEPSKTEIENAKNLIRSNVLAKEWVLEKQLLWASTQGPGPSAVLTAQINSKILTGQLNTVGHPPVSFWSFGSLPIFGGISTALCALAIFVFINKQPETQSEIASVQLKDKIAENKHEVGTQVPAQHTHSVHVVLAHIDNRKILIEKEDVKDIKQNPLQHKNHTLVKSKVNTDTLSNVVNVATASGDHIIGEETDEAGLFKDVENVLGVTAPEDDEIYLDDAAKEAIKNSQSRKIKISIYDLEKNENSDLLEQLPPDQFKGHRYLIALKRKKPSIH